MSLLLQEPTSMPDAKQSRTYGPRAGRTVPRQVDEQVGDDDRRRMLSSHPAAVSLRARISIPTLVGETVDLSGAGHELRGRCSTHPDRDRSLFVHDAKGLYRCFACGRHGDVVQWRRELARCGEEEAIAILERRAEAGSPQD